MAKKKLSCPPPLPYFFGRVDGRTDGRTDGQPDYIMPPATGSRRHKNTASLQFWIKGYPLLSTLCDFVTWFN